MDLSTEYRSEPVMFVGELTRLLTLDSGDDTVFPIYPNNLLSLDL
jgi:hypothetical protein